MSSMQKPQNAPVQPVEVPEKFTVRPGKTFFVLGLLLVFLCGGAAIHSFVTQPREESMNMIVAGGICVVAGIMTLLKYKNQRLEVDGEELCYQSMVGRKICFHASDITYVTKDISKNPKVMGEGDRVLACFDRNMENFPQMIMYLQNHHVPFNK